VFPRRRQPSDQAPVDIGCVMIASEGRPIADEVVQRAVDLARPSSATVHVLSIARIWGTSLGFPNPGLMPTKREWDEQRAIVKRAVTFVEKAGLEARGNVIGTRRARKRIVAEARRVGADVIVMGADRDRGLLGDFVWAHEPYRVARRAHVPVHLVQAPGG
jgi:nucleotide-binding universal stress UspA family protein